MPRIRVGLGEVLVGIVIMAAVVYRSKRGSHGMTRA